MYHFLQPILLLPIFSFGFQCSISANFVSFFFTISTIYSPFPFRSFCSQLFVAAWHLSKRSSRPSRTGPSAPLKTSPRATGGRVSSASSSAPRDLQHSQRFQRPPPCQLSCKDACPQKVTNYNEMPDF